MSINKVILVGRLGQDPEAHETNTGLVANVTVATSFKTRDGEKKTTWHRVALWRNQAKFADQYLHKGDEVYIEGRIDYREWTDKDNHKHVSAEIVAYDCQGLGSRDRGATGHTERPKDYPEKDGNTNDGFDEIPF